MRLPSSCVYTDESHSRMIMLIMAFSISCVRPVQTLVFLAWHTIGL